MPRGKPSLDEVPGAEAFLPEKLSLPTLRDAVQGCRGCTLYQCATQAVFGAGSPSASVMFVGEVPGDREDLEGKPFVGPAGRLLDEALDIAEIPRTQAYVTNAVKHFKYTRRGKKRIHDKPTRYEIEACKPWLLAEIEVVKPDIVVLLGATAAQALLGPAFRVTRSRGQALRTNLATWTFATVHPASVLRAPDEETRHEAKLQFIHDIEVIGEYYKAVWSGATAAGHHLPGAELR